MSEDQIFEFKGNALIHFRVRLRSTSLSVSTIRERSGPAVKTWDVSFSHIDAVRVAERRGASTRMAGLYLKPRAGSMVMFAWQKNAAGAPAREAQTYYAAAIATLRGLAEERPDLSATIGPHRASLIGTTLGAITFVAVAYLVIGQLNTTFAVTAAAIVTTYAYSAAHSGVFQKSRRVSLSQAIDELTANASV